MGEVNAHIYTYIWRKKKKELKTVSKKEILMSFAFLLHPGYSDRISMRDQAKHS